MMAVGVLGGVAVQAVLDEALRVQPVQDRIRVRRQLVRVHHLHRGSTKGWMQGGQC